MQIISFGKMTQANAGTPVRMGYTTLAANLSASANSMTVTSAQPFCQDMLPFKLDIDPTGTRETVMVTAISGTTFTITRGADNTTPVAHLSGVALQAKLLVSGMFVATINTNSSYTYWGKYTLNVSSGAGIIKELFPKSTTNYDDVYDLSLAGDNTFKMTDFAFDAHTNGDAIFVTFFLK